MAHYGRYGERRDRWFFWSNWLPRGQVELPAPHESKILIPTLTDKGNTIYVPLPESDAQKEFKRPTIPKESHEEKSTEAKIAKSPDTQKEKSNVCWEWRTFENLDEDVAKKIMELPEHKTTEITDTYLFYHRTHEFNIKIRDNSLKIKKYLYSENGAELWQDYGCGFPMSCDTLRKLLDGTGLPVKVNQKRDVTLEDFVDMVESSDEITPIKVHKQRIMKKYKGCGIDINLLSVEEDEPIERFSDYIETFQNGKGLEEEPKLETPKTEYVTVGVEAYQKKKLLEVVKEFGLEKYKQQNYSKFLKKLNSQ